MIIFALNLALACLLAETTFLVWRGRRTGEPLSSRTVATLAAGFFLLLAFRLDLANVPVFVVLLLLAAGGACHLFDMIGRAGPTRAGPGV